MTKRKKKVPTLPYKITPVLPDYEKGTEIFNNNANVNEISSDNATMSLGEDIKDSIINLDNLQMEVVTTTSDFLIETGVEEDDVPLFTDFEIEDEGDRIRIEIRCELDYDNIFELIQLLNPIVIKYDDNAYFDVEQPGVIIAYIYKNNSLIESLLRLDNQAIKNTVYSDLVGLYESTQDKLSEQDKVKLADFVKKTDDVEEVETYMHGLLNKKKTDESLLEYIDSNVKLETELDNNLKSCDGNIYNKVPQWCKVYLDEFDAPWVHYGELPSGICFYSDDYDTIFLNDLDDFIKDQMFNLQELQKNYFENPEQYDFSVEFTNLLESDLDKVFSGQQKLTEDNYPDDIHMYDDDPRSPLYNGPEAENAGVQEGRLEVKFSQRGEIPKPFGSEMPYWESYDFDEDFQNLDFDEQLYFDDVEAIDINKDFRLELEEALSEIFDSTNFQNKLPLFTPGIYRVSGSISLPYTIYDVTILSNEYDFSNVSLSFDINDADISKLKIERIS